MVLVNERIDYSRHVRAHDSRIVRAALVALGLAFVAIGIAGVVLPVLPATPCFLRATSIAFFVEGTLLRGLLAVLGGLLAVWMWCIPSRDTPR
ncbi:MAG: hypothetical protein IT529_11430 [Burkholderiales bacterium]|nr:hypothetical protein [Burkholderiales bacterium]